MYPPLTLTVYCSGLYLRFDQSKVSPGHFEVPGEFLAVHPASFRASGLDPSKLPGDLLLDLVPSEHLVSLQ